MKIEGVKQLKGAKSNKTTTITTYTPESLQLAKHQVLKTDSQTLNRNLIQKTTKNKTQQKYVLTITQHSSLHNSDLQTGKNDSTKKETKSLALPCNKSENNSGLQNDTNSKINSQCQKRLTSSKLSKPGNKTKPIPSGIHLSGNHNVSSKSDTLIVKWLNVPDLKPVCIPSKYPTKPVQSGYQFFSSKVPDQLSLKEPLTRMPILTSFLPSKGRHNQLVNIKPKPPNQRNSTDNKPQMPNLKSKLTEQDHSRFVKRKSVPVLPIPTLVNGNQPKPHGSNQGKLPGHNQAKAPGHNQGKPQGNNQGKPPGNNQGKPPGHKQDKKPNHGIKNPNGQPTNLQNCNLGKASQHVQNLGHQNPAQGVSTQNHNFILNNPNPHQWSIELKPLSSDSEHSVSETFPTAAKLARISIDSKDVIETKPYFNQEPPHFKHEPPYFKQEPPYFKQEPLYFNQEPNNNLQILDLKEDTSILMSLKSEDDIKDEPGFGNLDFKSSFQLPLSFKYLDENKNEIKFEELPEEDRLKYIFLQKNDKELAPPCECRPNKPECEYFYFFTYS